MVPNARHPKGRSEPGPLRRLPVSAFELLNSISAVPQSHKDLWRKRLSAPNEKLAPIMSAGGSPNSYCYRMLSEWNRYRLRLAYDQSTIVNAIESLWGNTEKKGHRNLIVSTRWNLFLDKLTSPDSLH